MSLLPKIVEWLTTQGVPFQQLHHAPTLTSRDSAAARGESLSSGGKALLLSCDGEFRLFVLPAARKLDSAAIRQELPYNKCRFATPAELLTRPGLIP
ncbi:MAG: YbaK/EbsC family protein, partial [Planctomycetaceae bacterium]